MRNLFTLPVALVLAVAAGGACSDSTSGASSSGSSEAVSFGCREPMDEDFCAQYHLEDDENLQATKDGCAAGGAREVIDACPTKSVAGCCVLETAFYVAHQCYYAPTKSDEVKNQCAMLGQEFASSP